MTSKRIELKVWLILIFIMQLNLQTLLGQQAQVLSTRSNYLEVVLPGPVEILNSDGWYLVGGSSEIKRLVGGSGGSTLLFELTDHVLPDDDFTLTYYPELGNVINLEVVSGISDLSVSNEVNIYQGTRTVYYVSSEGSISNTGLSPSLPTTFSQAQQLVKAGDYILFKRGETYTEQVSLREKHGMQGAYITLGYYGDGSAPRLNYSGSEPLSLIGCSYVQVVGFHVTPSLGSNGVRLDRGSRYCKLRSLRVEGQPTSASESDSQRRYGSNAGIVYSKYGGQESRRSVQCQVLHSYIDTFRRGLYGESPNQCFIAFNRVKNMSEDGIRVIQGDASGTRITGNEITDWSDDAIDMYNCSNAIIEYNIIHDPMLPLDNGANNGIKGGGVYKSTLGEPTSENNKYRYNKIYNLPMRLGFTPAGITTNGCLSGEIYGNLCYNIEHNAIEITRSDRLSDEWRVYNNTAISEKYNGIFVAPDNPKVAVSNNIVSGGMTDIRVNGNTSGVTGRNNILLNGK